MTDPSKKVQLVGEELKDLRARLAVVFEHIEEISRVTLEKVGHKPLKLGPQGIFKVIIMPHNSKLIMYDKDSGRCAGVYEDPPGECRPCNDPYSTDGHSE